MRHRDSCLRLVEGPEVGHGGALRRPEGLEAARALLELGARRQGC
ncbi:hypothetical protein [Paucibacter soli]